MRHSKGPLRRSSSVVRQDDSTKSSMLRIISSGNWLSPGIASCTERAHRRNVVKAALELANADREAMVCSGSTGTAQARWTLLLGIAS